MYYKTWTEFERYNHAHIRPYLGMVFVRNLCIVSRKTLF
jgi:hypothetical protein